MLFDKKLMHCKTQKNGIEMMHRIEFHHALSKMPDIRYRIIERLMNGKAIIIDIDTALFMPSVRMNPSEYIEGLTQKLAAYQLKYKISRIKKEVLDAGIGRVFGMKASKTGITYRASIYIPYEVFSTELYEQLLENSGYRVCILNDQADPDELLELFYSGMVDDLDYSEVFYAHFYCNEQLAQIVVASRHIQKDQMNHLIEELVSK